MARRDSITVRVSVQEREFLDAQAKAEGRTLGDVARRRLFGAPEIVGVAAQTGDFITVNAVGHIDKVPQDKAPRRKTTQDDAPAVDKEKARVCAVLGHEWHADGHCLKCGGTR